MLLAYRSAYEMAERSKLYIRISNTVYTRTSLNRLVLMLSLFFLVQLLDGDHLVTSMHSSGLLELDHLDIGED